MKHALLLPANSLLVSRHKYVLAYASFPFSVSPTSQTAAFNSSASLLQENPCRKHTIATRRPTTRLRALLHQIPAKAVDAAQATTLPLIQDGWPLIGLLLLSAAVSVVAETRTQIGATLSTPVLTMGCGIALSSAGIIPVDCAIYDAVWKYLMPLGAACYLLETDFSSIKGAGGLLCAAFLLGALGMVIGGCLGYTFFKGFLGAEGKQLACCLCASYIGGTANFAAVAKIVGISADIIPAAMAIDNVAMAVCLAVLIGSSMNVTAPNDAVTASSSENTRSRHLPRGPETHLPHTHSATSSGNSSSSTPSSTPSSSSQTRVSGSSTPSPDRPAGLSFPHNSPQQLQVSTQKQPLAPAIQQSVSPCSRATDTQQLQGSTQQPSVLEGQHTAAAPSPSIESITLAMAAAAIACALGEVVAHAIRLPNLDLACMSVIAMVFAFLGSQRRLATPAQEAHQLPRLQPQHKQEQASPEPGQQDYLPPASTSGAQSYTVSSPPTPFAGASQIGGCIMAVFFSVIGASAGSLAAFARPELLPIMGYIFTMVGTHWAVMWAASNTLFHNMPLNVMVLGSNACIGGPATAAGMAASKGWSSMVQAAMLSGSLGYAVGTTAGLVVARFVGLNL